MLTIPFKSWVLALLLKVTAERLQSPGVPSENQSGRLMQRAVFIIRVEYSTAVSSLGDR